MKAPAVRRTCVRCARIFPREEQSKPRTGKIRIHESQRRSNAYPSRMGKQPGAPPHRQRRKSLMRGGVPASLSSRTNFHRFG